METKVAVFRSWDDVVFENRNRSYGAYVLRKAYAQRLILGWGISIALMSALLFSAENTLEKVKAIMPPPPTKEITITVLPPPPMRDPQPRQESHPKKSNVKNTQVRVVSDPVDEPAPTNEEIVAAQTGDETGDGDVGIIEGTGVISDIPVVAPSGPVDYAEVMPEYEGGFEGIMKFVRKNIRVPRSARNLGASGTVYVSFVVDGNGKVIDVSVLRGFHPDCDKEAVRVIGLLPKWKGGRQNGNPVSVRMVLPIRFDIQ